jgi:hypothetical protein
MLRRKKKTETLVFANKANDFRRDLARVHQREDVLHTLKLLM